MIEISKAFKSLLFFGTIHDKTEEQKNFYSQALFVKVFKTNNLDEMNQILDMSEKTAVIIDNISSYRFLLKNPIDSKKPYRIFYPDWELLVDKDDIQSMRVNGFAVIKAKESSQLLEAVELYLFGKVNIFNKHSIVEPKLEINHNISKSYFTHLLLKDNRWITEVSTHEKEANINEIIGKDWHEFLKDTLSKVHLYNQPIETKLWQKPFFEIIFPHWYGDQLQKISIAHIPLDSKAEENINKIRSFFQNI